MNTKTLDRKISDSLERLSTAIQVFLEDQSEKLNINSTQGKILLYLLHHPDQTGQTSRMAREMRLTKATISDSVDQLVNQDFIERGLSEEDRRVIELELTEKGLEAARTLSGWPEVLEQYMEGFSRKEKQTVLQFLMNLIKGSLKENAIPTARMCTTCRFFNQEPEEMEAPYYCDLLEITLDPETIRVDCDEQEPIEEVNP